MAARTAATNLKLVALPRLSDETAKKLGHGITPSEVRNAIESSQEGQADIVGVSATHENKATAAAIANAVRDAIDVRPTTFPLTPARVLALLGRAPHLPGETELVPSGPLPAKDTATADSIKATWPKDTLVAKLKASLTFCENAFAQLDDAKLTDQVSLSFNGTSRQVPRISMVLGHALDMADHYSQLANYMRLNNIIPPTALPRPGRGGQ